MQQVQALLALGGAEAVEVAEGVGAEGGLREEVERRKRRASLKELVEELEAYYGPADPEDVERARQAMREAKAEAEGL